MQRHLTTIHKNVVVQKPLSMPAYRLTTHVVTVYRRTGFYSRQWRLFGVEIISWTISVFVSVGCRNFSDVDMIE